VQPFLSVASTIKVVAEHPNKYQELGFETLVDPIPNLGPLGGVYAALTDHQGRDDFLLCASCDRVGIQPHWLKLLLEHRNEPVKIVAFRGTIWEPLPALYHQSLLPEVSAALLDRRLAPWKLMEQMPSVVLPLPSDWDIAVDVNQSDDLLRLKSLE
jgi:molybdopterin-guanine dinucleotide biosynthesis protein A